MEIKYGRFHMRKIDWKAFKGCLIVKVDYINYSKIYTKIFMQDFPIVKVVIFHRTSYSVEMIDYFTTYVCANDFEHSPFIV